ncbi:MAG: aminotransferase class V-fold PLP-dependent enzyme [Eubacteriales bacterium]
MSILYARREDYTIDSRDVLNALREDTALVSIMHVNNETGAVNDIYNISKMVKARNPETFFHSDGVQAFLKMPIYLANGEVDFYSMSAHKINALKGTGALYIKNANKVKPLIVGGGQEGALRSGTENTFGIACFSAAVDEHLRNIDKEAKRIEFISKKLKSSLSNMEDVSLNSPPEDKCVPNIINVSVLGVHSETLLHALEARGIYVSMGSACSSRKNVGSRILKAQGISGDRLRGAIRISLGISNTLAEADMFLNVLEQEINTLRRFKKR